MPEFVRYRCRNCSEEFHIGRVCDFVFCPFCRSEETERDGGLRCSSRLGYREIEDSDPDE